MNSLKHQITSVIVIGLYIGIFSGIAKILGTYFILNFGDENKCNVKNCENQGEAKEKLNFTYTSKDVLLCLDNLATRKENKILHIAFIGDSLVRNQFRNFIQLIPDYDRTISKTKPWENLYFDSDKNVTYRLMNNFRISFHWRPLMFYDFFDVFKKWNASDESQAPSIIFIGASVHHMLSSNYKGRSYEEILEKYLLPVLRDYLTTRPYVQLVWLIQPPSLDRHISIPLALLGFPEINYNVIRYYNDIARKIFKGTRIMIWDLFDPFVKEYDRGCVLTDFKRQNNNNFFHCTDNIHPGFGVTFSFATQLLYKKICNL